LTADVLQLLNTAAATYGVAPALAIEVANQESGGNQYNADGSLKISPAGAIGVMQLMPGTAAQLGVNPSDTAQNIDGGVRYLAQLLAQFNGDQQLALAAYNWGPGHVSQNGYSNWPTETVNYVSSIMSAIGSAFTPGGTSDDGSASSAAPSTGALIALGLVGALVFWSMTEVFL